MLQKKYIWLFIFAIILVLFSFFSTRVDFHDSFEYITVAKNLAGIKNVPIYATHPIVYPALIALFLKMWPNFIIIKLINSLWVFLIGLVLFFLFKDKKAFILFLFSPLTWFISIQTSPVLPSSFFFILAFYFFKKDSGRKNQSISAFLMGLSCAVYTPLILVTGIFILIYFWKKPLSNLLIYLLIASIAFIPALIIDSIIFGNPFYTIIRYFGASFVISAGVHPWIHGFALYGDESYLILFAISPLLFMLYRIKIKDYGKELLFVIVTGLMLNARTGSLGPFFIIAAPIFLLLSKVLTQKEIKWHCILSIIITVALTFNYFSPSGSYIIIQSDLKDIIRDYQPNVIVANPAAEANKFATFLWTNSPEIIWFEDYIASKNNVTYIRGYTFEFKPIKIKTNNVLEIKANFNRYDNVTYNNLLIVTQDRNLDPEMFRIDKCYQKLCVYREFT